MTSTRRNTGRRRPASPTPPQRKLPIVPIVFGVIAVGLITVVLVSFSGETEAEDEYGNPSVTGTVLPRFEQADSDPAVGSPAPEVTGAGFDGTPVVIENDGRPKMVVFLAHWCPHCQAEVPDVQAWVDAGNLPEGIDLYSVSTSMSRTRDNFPASRWLERETWSAPVIADDEDSSVADAYGLSAFPFWVFIEADGTVAGRITGGLQTSTLDQIAVDLLAN